MLSKLSGEEIIKGIVSDYPKIKDEFKKTLYDNGFRWQKDSYTGNEFGNEAVWINYGLRLSIRARWGKVNANAIIYVEKEFFAKVKKFFDLCFTNDGMDSENSDYDLLNKGELFKKDDKKDDKKVKNKKRKDKKDTSRSGDDKKSKSEENEGNMSPERVKQVMEENKKDHPSTRRKRAIKGKCKECKEDVRQEILDEFDGMCEECHVEINGDPEGQEEYPEQIFGE